MQLKEFFIILYSLNFRNARGIVDYKILNGED